jgi:DNA/RNA endonuclease YhcR with UshA esterase domain
MWKGIAVLAVAAGITSVPIAAHHSAAAHYDVEKTTSISGVVQEFRYTNPHAVVRLTVKNAQGGQEVWSVEWAPTTILRRLGVKPDTIKAGDQVTATGSPARDGSQDMLMQRLTFADGRPPIGGGGPGQPGDSNNNRN